MRNVLRETLIILRGIHDLSSSDWELSNRNPLFVVVSLLQSD